MNDSDDLHAFNQPIDPLSAREAAGEERREQFSLEQREKMSALGMFFVCDGARDWWNCYGVLSNGFCFGQHICSDPGFAPGDLYFGRAERVAALRELFGVDPETIECQTIVVRTLADKPEWWDGQKALQDGLAPQYERYSALLKGETTAPVVELLTDSK